MTAPMGAPHFGPVPSPSLDPALIPPPGAKEQRINAKLGKLEYAQTFYDHLGEYALNFAGVFAGDIPVTTDVQLSPTYVFNAPEPAFKHASYKDALANQEAERSEAAKKAASEQRAKKNNPQAKGSHKGKRGSAASEPDPDILERARKTEERLWSFAEGKRRAERDQGINLSPSALRKATRLEDTINGFNNGTSNRYNSWRYGKHLMSQLPPRDRLRVSEAPNSPFPFVQRQFYRPAITSAQRRHEKQVAESAPKLRAARQEEHSVIEAIRDRTASRMRYPAHGHPSKRWVRDQEHVLEQQWRSGQISRFAYDAGKSALEHAHIPAHTYPDTAHLRGLQSEVGKHTRKIESITRTGVVARRRSAKIDRLRGKQATLQQQRMHQAQQAQQAINLAQQHPAGS